MRTAAEIVKGWDDPESGLLEDSELVSAWTDFLLQYQFEWFVTFTFRDSVHPENADKLFTLWINELNQHLYGRRWKAAPHKQVFWVRALEWQKRGVLHFHALIGDTRPLAEQIRFSKNGFSKASLMYWEERWFSLAGICRIEEIKVHEFVSRYVSKYVAKDGEIDVSENLKDFVPPQPGLRAQ